MTTASALPSGAAIAIRAVTAHDRPLIERGLALLSVASLQTRFGKPVRPEPCELDWMALLDGQSAAAYGACDSISGTPVGLARYVAASAAQAEVAVTVADAWQGHGIGTSLLRRLATHADQAGFSALTATIDFDNRAAIALMKRIGARALVPGRRGQIELISVISS